MDLFTEPQLPYTPGVVWTPLSVITLIVLLAAVPGNAIVLYRFLLDPALCSPINIYLINLFAANLLSVLLNIPLTLVNNLRGGWWTGHASCTALLYSRILLAGIFATHLLITVSRLWAVVAPESYLRRHTRRVAAGVCAVMWLLIHAFKLPVLIADSLYYRRWEPQYGCAVNNPPQVGLVLAQQIIVYLLPVIIIFAAYPIICIKTSQRQQDIGRILPAGRLPIHRRNSTLYPFAPTYHRVLPSSELCVTNGDLDINAALRERQCRMLALSQLELVDGLGPPVFVVRPDPPEPPAVVVSILSNQDLSPAANERIDLTRGLVVLTLSTVCVLVVWVPNVVYSTTRLFVPVTVPISMWEVVATALWYVEVVADPVMFILAVRELREAVICRVCE